MKQRTATIDDVVATVQNAPNSPRPTSTKTFVLGMLAMLSTVFVLTNVQEFASIRMAMNEGYSSKKIRREQLLSTMAVPNSESLLINDVEQRDLSAHGNSGEKKEIPCQLLGIGGSTNINLNAQDNSNNITADASRFHASTLDSWACHQEDTDDYFLVTLKFQIRECPPKYSASSFQLRASTPASRVMGHVGNRYKVKNECGIYNASVAVMDYVSNSGAVDIELFWTSGFRHYSNHIKDITDAHTVKEASLPEDQIKVMFTDERLAYLQRHLDRLPNFPIQLQIQVSRATFNNDPLLLPDCGTIPLDDWNPTGVFDGPVNDTSHLAPPDEAARWPFRAARCQFHARTLPQYNELLAGLRIKFLGDSHMTETHYEALGLMCPEMEDKAYFDRDYDCNVRNNTFNVAYRFFRAVFQEDFDSDMDGLSRNFRMGSSKSCREILGLGLFNATIITIPHWIFVYETQEGLDHILTSFQSLFENCQVSHPALMKDHIILLQSASARDAQVDENAAKAPWQSWRGIHNHRVEDFSRAVEHKLRHYVDGIIPFFEMSYARTVTIRTKDGTHLPKSSYRDMLHVQWSAIRSAMKYSRGLDLPLMQIDDPGARWFAGLEKE